MSAALIILIAAVLPGIAALFFFYSGVSTTEVRISPPQLGSIVSISLVGFFAIAAHIAYVGILRAAAAYPCKLGLPLANPYLVLSDTSDRYAIASMGWSLIGLAWLTIIGGAFGRLAASLPWKARDEFLFGWLMPVIRERRIHN